MTIIICKGLICLFNIHSVVNKLSNFQSLVCTSSFNVFCICESWLSSSIYYHKVMFSDFVLYCNDQESQGGGVFIAVHNSIPSSLVSAPPDLEIVSIILSSFVLFTVYIPPNCSEDYFFSVIDYLSELVNSNNKCIIAGDFNLPDICWSSLISTNHLSLHFCDFVFDYNLSQHVSVLTHIHGNTLDLVISPGIDISDLIVTHHFQFISSDHYVVSFFPSCMSLSYSQPKPKYVFVFSKADYNSVFSFPLDVDSSVCLLCSNIQFIWAMIRSVLYHAMCL